MADNNPTVSKIIERCGGRDAVAKKLKVSVHLVRKWPASGIPWWYWPEIMEMAPTLYAGELLNANIETGAGLKAKKRK